MEGVEMKNKRSQSHNNVKYRERFTHTHLFGCYRNIDSIAMLEEKSEKAKYVTFQKTHIK